jgi:hypothetical protein
LYLKLGAFGCQLASRGRQLRTDFHGEVLVLRAAGQLLQGHIAALRGHRLLPG